MLRLEQLGWARIRERAQRQERGPVVLPLQGRPGELAPVARPERQVAPVRAFDRE